MPGIPDISHGVTQGMSEITLWNASGYGWLQHKRSCMSKEEDSFM